MFPRTSSRAGWVALLFASALHPSHSARITQLHVSPLASQHTSGLQQLPVVIWHGLGDGYQGTGIRGLAQAIHDTYPGKSVYLIRLADSNQRDRQATWFGSANEQVQSVCEQLARISQLQSGFDAIGFSQGGQLMRAYVERCNSPKVRNLITLGAQHMGISGVAPCKSVFDFGCHALQKLIRLGTVYNSYAQNHIIPAQYFRDQSNIFPYLTQNEFLRDINNERFNDTQIKADLTQWQPLSHLSVDKVYEPRNSTYKANFQSLNNFVMFRFTMEHIVIPWSSAYFTLSDGNSNMIRLQDLPIYQEDYIGLKALDLAGKIQYGQCQGEHMVIDQDCWREVMSWLSPNQRRVQVKAVEEALPQKAAIDQQMVFH